MSYLWISFASKTEFGGLYISETRQPIDQMDGVEFSNPNDFSGNNPGMDSFDRLALGLVFDVLKEHPGLPSESVQVTELSPEAWELIPTSFRNILLNESSAQFLVALMEAV